MFSFQDQSPGNFQHPFFLAYSVCGTAWFFIHFLYMRLYYVGSRKEHNLEVTSAVLDLTVWITSTLGERLCLN